MRTTFFVAALEGLASSAHRPLVARTLELPFPDSPALHSAPGTALDGLGEFVGTPDEVAGFVADAEVLVDHMGPVTAGVLARCHALRLIVVPRGGPINVDMAAARRRGVVVAHAPGRNASGVAECTIGMILAQTRLLTLGHDALPRGQ